MITTDGPTGSATPSPVTPLERLKLCHNTMNWLYRELYPGSGPLGMSGPPGPGSRGAMEKYDRETNEERLVDDICYGLQQIRKKLGRGNSV